MSTVPTPKPAPAAPKTKTTKPTMFTEAEQNAYYNKRPAKRMGAGVLLFSPDGHLLIVKPSYKEGWAVPGGVSEKNESPFDTAYRETKEEIGLEISKDRLALFGIRYTDERDGLSEGVELYFMTTLTEQELTSITLQASELSDKKLVDPSEIDKYTDHPHMKAIVAGLNAGHVPVFIHNETVETRVGV